MVCFGKTAMRCMLACLLRTHPPRLRRGRAGRAENWTTHDTRDQGFRSARGSQRTGVHEGAAPPPSGSPCDHASPHALTHRTTSGRRGEKQHTREPKSGSPFSVSVPGVPWQKLDATGFGVRIPALPGWQKLGLSLAHRSSKHQKLCALFWLRFIYSFIGRISSFMAILHILHGNPTCRRRPPTTTPDGHNADALELRPRPE